MTIPRDLRPEPIATHEPRSSVELWSTRAGRQQRVRIFAGDEQDAIDDLIDRAVDAWDRLIESDDSPPFRSRVEQR